MNISKNSVVQFHYTLADESNEQLESSYDGDPVAYLHGHGNMISGVEKALEGKAQGDEFSTTVAPEDGYGDINEEAIQRIPTKHLQGSNVWVPGMVATVNTEQGERQVTVVKVGRFMVTVDTNHPLAGRTLTFNIKVESIRAATEEEIEHGHAHGVGGHQH